MEAQQILTESDIARYVPIIDNIFQNANLATVSVKKVRNGLSDETGIDFRSIKKQIDTIITSRFDKILAERTAADEALSSTTNAVKSEEPSVKSETPDTGARSSPVESETSTVAGTKRKSSAVEDEDARLAAELHAALNGGRPSRSGAKPRSASSKTKAGPGKKRKTKKSKAMIGSDDDSEADTSTPKKKRAMNPNNAFNRPLVLAPKLAELVGETEMSRPGVVKAIWAYVKEHNLQDPNDKRFIVCDAKLHPLFGDKVHMFTMNKILNQFMYKPEEIAGGAPAKTVKSEVKNDGFDEDSPPPKSEGDDDEAMNTPPASSAPLAQSHDVKEENGTSSPDGDDDDDSLFGGDE